MRRWRGWVVEEESVKEEKMGSRGGDRRRWVVEEEEVRR